MAGGSGPNTAASRHVQGTAGSHKSSGDHSRSLKGTAAATATVTKSSTGLQGPAPSTAAHGLQLKSQTRVAGGMQLHAAKPCAVSKSVSSSSTPRISANAAAGPGNRAVAGPIPGKARVVQSPEVPNTRVSVHALWDPDRAANMGLSPAMVNKTSRPPSSLGRYSSLPSTSNSMASRVAAAAAGVKSPSSRAAGVSSTHISRHGSDAAQGAKRILQRSSSSLSSPYSSGFDAVAAERQLMQRGQQQGYAARPAPAANALTYPGTIARSHQRVAGQPAATTQPTAAALGSRVGAAQQLAGMSSNGLCGVGSPTNDGFLDRLHRKNKSVAAAAADAAEAMPVQAAALSSGSAGAGSSSSGSGGKAPGSGLAAAMERLRALSFSRHSSRTSGSGSATMGSAGTSSRGSREDSAASVSAGSAAEVPTPGSGAAVACCAGAAVDSHAASAEALIDRNRQQLAESLSRLSAAVSTGREVTVQCDRSYSLVAATADVDSSTREADSSNLTSSRVVTQAITARGCAAAGHDTHGAAGSSQDIQMEASRDPCHQQQEKLPVYDPVRYSGTAAAALAPHSSGTAAAVAAAVEAAGRRSSSGSDGLCPRGIYNPAVAAAAAAKPIYSSPFAVHQPAPSSDRSLAADGVISAGSQVRRLCDGSDSGSAGYISPLVIQQQQQQQQQQVVQTQQEQQQRQASLLRMASRTSSILSTGRQPSFLISTRPMSGDCDDIDSCAESAASDKAFNACDRSAAVDLHSRQEFLGGGSASRSSSLNQPGAGTAGQAGLDRELRQTAAPAVATNNNPSHNRQSLQQQQQWPAMTTGKISIPVVVADSDSDSDISEMSSSLDRADSSSEGSDSDEGITAAAAARRRLVGGRVTLGSSISISSSEGRSSSCGSGKELDALCSTGRQISGSVAAAHKGQLPPGCVGLNNLGNTCFMNSILQCLNCLPELVAALLDRQAIQQPQLAAAVGLQASDLQRIPAARGSGVQWHSKASVGPALSALFTEIWSGQQYGSSVTRQRVVSPRNFLRAAAAADDRWGGGCQQDSQEFLHSLLEQMQSECNRVTGKPQYKELSGKGSEADQAAEAAAYARSWHDSLVDDLFGGFLQSTITCSTCKHQSHCFDPFLDLSVPIPKCKQVSLQDCLSGFVEQEILTGSEQVKCSACKKTCDATKQLQIYSYPRLLVLTLKRFNSCSKGGSGFGDRWYGSFSPLSKNQTPVKLDAQHALDLAPYCNPIGLKSAAAEGLNKPRYELLAVSEHSGCLGGGHYTAQGRNVSDVRWYDFNDSSVTPDSRPSGSSSTAYVLFYRLLDA